MKKFTVAFLALAVLVIPSCKNAGKKTETKEVETSQWSSKEEMITEDLKINLKNLAESAKKLKPAPFITNEEGELKLSEKEMMVKPDYLLDPAIADNLVTLSQKYRCTAMLYTDRVIASLYQMPLEKYDAALAKLTADVGDSVFSGYFDNLANNDEDAFSSAFDTEVEEGRITLFWEAVVAFSVEQLYVVTRDIDMFMPMFDDESASDITYQFICVHDGIEQMIALKPEMESLQAVMEPLYVINAINVEQLRSQLTELKGSIESVRASLLQ